MTSEEIIQTKYKYNSVYRILRAFRHSNNKQFFCLIQSPLFRSAIKLRYHPSCRYSPIDPFLLIGASLAILCFLDCSPRILWEVSSRLSLYPNHLFSCSDNHNNIWDSQFTKFHPPFKSISFSNCCFYKPSII
jgi:hypothetical protein